MKKKIGRWQITWEWNWKALGFGIGISWDLEFSFLLMGGFFAVSIERSL